MVHSVLTGQLVFSSRPVVRTVRYVIPLVNTSEQVGEYLVLRVRQFMRPSPSWRKKLARRDFFNEGPCIFLHCYFVYRKRNPSSIIIRSTKNGISVGVYFQRHRRFSARDVRVTIQILSLTRANAQVVETTGRNTRTLASRIYHLPSGYRICTPLVNSTGILSNS